MLAEKKDQLILVTGATGKQGSAAVLRLTERGFSVRALTRDPDQPAVRVLTGHGAEVVRGDLEDRESLMAALDGAYGVFAVLTPYEAGVDAEVRQGKNLADAAARAGVKHFVYSSVGSADQNTGIPHFESKARIEEHIRRLDMAWTIIRPVFFMENLLSSAHTLREGRITSPLTPDRKLQMIAVTDIGAFAAIAFDHPGRWKGRAIDIAGDQISGSQLADVFSNLFVRHIRYEQVPWGEFEDRAGREITRMWRWFQDVGYHADIPALRREYPPLLTVERWAQAQDWGIARSA